MRPARERLLQEQEGRRKGLAHARAAVAGRLLHALAEAPLAVARVAAVRRRPRLGLAGAPQRVGGAAGAAGAAHGSVSRTVVLLTVGSVACVGSVARTMAR